MATTKIETISRTLNCLLSLPSVPSLLSSQHNEREKSRLAYQWEIQDSQKFSALTEAKTLRMTEPGWFTFTHWISPYQTIMMSLPIIFWIYSPSQPIEPTPESWAGWDKPRTWDREQSWSQLVSRRSAYCQEWRPVIRRFPSEPRFHGCLRKLSKTFCPVP